MERRKAIKNIGLSFGAFVATPTAISILQSCGGPSMEPWTPVFFSEQKGVLLRKLVDGMLPSTGELPSATDVNVHVFIDKFWDEVVPLDERDELMAAYNTLTSSLLSAAETDNPEKVSDEVMNSFLTERLAISKEEEEGLRSQITEAVEGGAEIGDLGEDLQLYFILNNLRGYAIWAYRTNETVGKNILAYDPVPGVNIGCGDLQELTGGRDWSEDTYLAL